MDEVVEKPKKEAPKKTHKARYIAAFAFTSVLGLWLASGWFLWTYDDRGTFGDMFGAVNALFSGLAFAGLLVTIYLQGTELDVQQAELDTQQEELKGHARLLNVQLFESTFFNLLRYHEKLVSGISQSEEGQTFQQFIDSFDQAMANLTGEEEGHSERIKEKYMQIYNDYELSFGAYFRSLYGILVFIDQCGLKDREKKRYSDILRSQSSIAELKVLYLNGLAYPNVELKRLIERYTLLKRIRASDGWIGPEKDLYASNAFKAG